MKLKNFYKKTFLLEGSVVAPQRGVVSIREHKIGASAVLLIFPVAVKYILIEMKTFWIPFAHPYLFVWY